MSRILIVRSAAKDGTVYENIYRDYHEWANKINQDKEAGYDVSWDAREETQEERYAQIEEAFRALKAAIMPLLPDDDMDIITQMRGVVLSNLDNAEHWAKKTSDKGNEYDGPRLFSRGYEEP